MRTLLLAPALGCLALAQAASLPADSTGLPGDHFDLHGALELFKNAADLDAFEQALNTEANHVNNLDLDANGETDYVHVVTHSDGDSRVIVLQVALAKEDLQDIAAIELEKSGEEKAMVQIRGDKELYPEGTIVEPVEEGKDGGKMRSGPSAPVIQVSVWLNVWAWPCVRWCYGPLWMGWHSPWYWGYRPMWWHPWRPMGWGMFWGYPRPYWGWYHPVHFCRVEHAHNVYMHRRVVSTTVVSRNATMNRQRSSGRAPERAAPANKTRTSNANRRTSQPTMRNSQPRTKQPTRSAPGRSTGGGRKR